MDSNPPENHPAHFPTFHRAANWIFQWRRLRWLLVGVAGLVTLVVLTAAIENFRGKRAWNKARQEIEATGDRLELDAVIPPPVPAERNFAATPLLRPLFDFEFDPKTHQTQWRDTNAYAAVRDMFGWMGAGPKFVRWRTADRAELGKWEEYLRSDRFTNSFSLPSETRHPAELVLAALGANRKELEEIKAAAQRPESRFDIPYHLGHQVLLPHLGVLRLLAQAFALKATAEVALGRPAEALDDIRTGLRLSDSIRTEPILISGLVRFSMIEIMIHPVWEGLERQVWNAEQLRLLRDTFAEIQPLASFSPVIRGERNLALFSIESLKRTRDGGPYGDGGSMALTLAFSGWFDQNKVHLARMYQDFLASGVDIAKSRVHREQIEQAEERAEAFLERRNPYRILARLMYPALANASSRFASSQTAVDLVQVACALELRRLEHGEYPETLSALVADQIRSLPHDVITGEPLRYRRQGTRFVLYSVGWNQTDDGGIPGKEPGRKTTNLEIKEGDWVWRY